MAHLNMSYDNMDYDFGSNGATFNVNGQNGKVLNKSYCGSWKRVVVIVFVALVAVVLITLLVTQFVIISLLKSRNESLDAALNSELTRKSTPGFTTTTTKPSQTTTQSTPGLTTKTSKPPQTTTRSIPGLTTKTTKPPQSSTRSTSGLTTKATKPPQSSTKSTPGLTTKATEPPQTTTRITPSLATKSTKPPQTTTAPKPDSTTQSHAVLTTNATQTTLDDTKSTTRKSASTTQSTPSFTPNATQSHSTQKPETTTTEGLTTKATTTQPDCIGQWLSYKGSCYLFGDESMTFLLAEDYCRQQNAHLVRIYDGDENNFLRTTILLTYTKDFWIGLTDIRTEMDWRWFGTTTTANFTYWATGKPDPSYYLRDCAIFRVSDALFWSDEPCDKPQYPLCERIEATRATKPPDCVGQWSLYNESCYMFGNQAMSFVLAEDYCRQQNAHLVHIGDSDENNFIRTTVLVNYPRDFWIGITDIHSDMDWRLFGTTTTATFTDWATGQPDDSDNRANCAILRASQALHWNNVRCEAQYPPLCERIYPASTTQKPEITTPSVPALTTERTSNCIGPWLSYKGSCYLFGGESMIFLLAEDYCRQQNAHLVRIYDGDENNFLRTTILLTYTKDFWIGLTDIRKEMDWRWFGTTTTANITYWATGKPNPSYYFRDCAIFRVSDALFWSDEPCDKPQYPLCERIEATRATKPPDCVGHWSLYNESCYMFGNQSMSFVLAEDYCRQQDAHLVHIGDSDENNFLRTTILVNNPRDLWIGITDLHSNMDWRLLGTTTTATFTDWATGQPDDSDNRANCVILRASQALHWNNVRCEAQYPPLCERIYPASTTQKPKITTPSVPALTTETTSNCADSWLSFKESCYLFGKEAMVFVLAEDYCRQQNAQLVSIYDSDENNFLRTTILLGSYTTDFWIGLTDMRTEMDWKWFGTNTTANFTYWATGKPNPLYNLRDCAILVYDALHWSDEPCDIPQYPLCETTKTTKPPQTPPGCVGQWMIHNASCYLFGNQSMTFVLAEDYCRQQNAHLVHIGDNDENNFLRTTILVNYSTDFWIGLTDIRTEKDWRWFGTTSSASFTDWATEEPSNSGSTGEDCAILRLSHALHWNDVTCDRTYPPLCERMYTAP